MKIETRTEQETNLAVIFSEEPIITDVQSALDFILSIKYQTGADRIIINKEALTEDFFKLHTGLAREILQKFINYRVKIAIYGDYSHYASKPLQEFICESNDGTNIFFAASEEDAVRRLTTRI